MKTNSAITAILLAFVLLAHLDGQTPAASKSSGPAAQSLSFARESSPQAASLAKEESSLRQKLDKDPQDATTLYLLGQTLREEQRFAESLNIYTRAAALQKPNASQLRSVALDYVQLNDFPDAIQWLRIALSLEPKNIDVLYSLGRCFYTENNFNLAEAAFKQVLKLEPHHIKAQENLGLTYDAELKTPLAEAALKAAVQGADSQSVGDPWPYIDLGNFYLDQSRVPEALPLLHKAAELAPGVASAHEKLGRALLLAKQPGEAAASLERAVALDPQNPKTHFELGRAYRDSGNAEKAAAEFATSKALYGNHNQN